MFQVIKNLINSEKAVASGVLVIASSVMVATGEITAAEWTEYTKTLLGIYVGGKTVQGAAAMFAAGGKGEVAKAKANEETAKKELSSLKGKLESNDAGADAALNAKFGDDDTPTDPGKKPHAATGEE
jgi:hypothetical protein